MPSTHFIKQIQEDSGLKEGDVSHVLEVGPTKSPGFSPRLVSRKVTSCVACLQEQREVSGSGQVAFLFAQHGSFASVTVLEVTFLLKAQVTYLELTYF